MCYLRVNDVVISAGRRHLWLGCEERCKVYTLQCPIVYSARKVSHEGRNIKRTCSEPICLWNYLKTFQKVPHSEHLQIFCDQTFCKGLPEFVRLLSWIDHSQSSRTSHYCITLCVWYVKLLAPLKGGASITFSSHYCTGRVWVIIRLRERTGCCKVTDGPDPSEPLLFKASIEVECPTVLRYVHIYPVRVDELVI